MSKNFKNIIRDRYKGRGNCWVKVPKENKVFNEVIEIANTSDGADYICHVEREGFAWIRFSKPTGNENNPQAIFEVRKRGSKIDHPDCIITINDNIAKDLPLLGNTPVKLQIEIDPAKRKVKKENNVPKRRKTSSKDQDVAVESITNKIEIIKETKLSNASALELKEWERFLELEGLLDYTY